MQPAELGFLSSSDLVNIDSWPGAEDVLEDTWMSVAQPSDVSSLMASFVADEWDKASLISMNSRLRNQVEVLAALAGRPCSGLANRSVLLSFYVALSEFQTG